MLNRYPYNNGHLLLVLRRHASLLGECTPDELAEMGGLLAAMERTLRDDAAPGRLQRRLQRRRQRRRRHPAAPAPAPAAPLARRHQLHEHRRRDPRHPEHPRRDVRPAQAGLRRRTRALTMKTLAERRPGALRAGRRRLAVGRQRPAAAARRCAVPRRSRWSCPADPRPPRAPGHPQRHPRRRPRQHLQPRACP